MYEVFISVVITILNIIQYKKKRLTISNFWQKEEKRNRFLEKYVQNGIPGRSENSARFCHAML